MKTGPLSFGQQRLWFLHQFDPEDPSHNAGYAYRLRGALDVPALEAAFTAVVARHEALRTRFTAADGTARAVVEDPRPVHVEVVAAESAGHAERVVATRANTPFDLTAEPPLRVTLVRIGPDDHVLCVVTHHINSDGWSFNLLRDEVATHYAGEALPAPPLQYADVVAAAGDTQADPAWWVGQLAGAPDLELPADRPRPAERSTSGGEVRFTLDAELADAVRALARQVRCTPYMVLLAAYEVLLARHSGQTDFCVGTPAAGRGRPELEGVIGYLSTTMVLRCDLSGDPSFTDLVRATRRSVLSGLAHPEVPFEQLVGALGVARDLSRTPIYQALFALHTHGTVAEPLPGLDAEPFPLGWHSARTDLTLDLYEQPDGSVVGILIHSADLFDDATAQRMAARFLHLLGSATTTPELPVSGLELLPVAERELLASWDGPVVELPPVTLVDLVRERARVSPEAVAVVSGTTVLTYRQLVGAAARLGAGLRGRGAVRGARVAVLSSRRAHMLVALLGVAMSGAAYVPVDPEYPQARIDYVVEDCGAALVLTDADLDGVLDDLDDGAVVELPRPEPADTAYVLYTSGSTGNPKGVVVPHRALTNFLLAMRTLVGSTDQDRWLALTSLSFDISALELYLPLTTGGRVIVADTPTTRDATALATLVRDEGVTHVQATPSGWRLLLTGDLPPGLTALCGGEPLPLTLATQLRARTTRLLNMYGPTETTIWSTAWDVPDNPHRVTIGTPIANTTVHVLDAHDTPTPIGVPGELLIGGTGLADGYHHRPDLTTQRFTTINGTRLYRTGDIVSRLPDGTLDYHGRTDDQLKLRGHRIEPGEIATALETHPHIRQAVVTVHDENLLAHYIPDQSEPDPAELRAHLTALLPGYMVPTTYIPLTTLPLTPNGKIDRKALPHPGSEQRPTGQGRAPQSAAEQLVAEIYAEVLDLGDPTTVRADDDFFALGGHSLRAAMLTARLNARSGAAIPIGDVFRHPVVADLARLVEAAAPGTVSAPVPRPPGTQPPLSPAQERLWFLARLDPQDASYNMWMAKRLRGPLDEAALRRALDAVTARHEILRTRFPEADGEPTAVVEPPSPVPVEMLTAADEHAAAELVSARTNTPLDLGAAPPLRATLIRLGADDHVVLLVMHHILGDGWSLNILYDELAALYSGRELPPLPVQFGDIALWQRRQDTTEALAYWQQRLAEPTPLALPLDRPRPAVPRRSGALTALRLGERETAALTRIGREHRSTMFMVLLAAYQAVLARHTGQNDILVGTVTAGRDRLELEPAIGYLTDVLVLRADLTDNPTLGDLLDRTRDDVLAAFAHQGIPFEELAAHLRVVRDPARTPLFQTMAILHTEDAEHAADAFAGLHTGHYDGGFEQAKFDLMLEAWHDDGGLLVTLVYDAEIFDAPTMDRLTERFGTLLRALPDHTGTPYSAVPILGPDDVTVLDGPALTETPTFLDQFAHQVRTRPDAIALTCGNQHLTYAQLDTRARELATTLPHHTVIGIRLGRTTDAIAAMIATWHAHSTYLPLDPDYPQARLDYMTHDSGAALVLTPDGPTPGTTPTPTTTDAAYLIYTSGSTGTPKGVTVPHTALATRITWMRHEYQLQPGDRIVQFASHSFDTHIEEIFPALASGARVDLLPDGPLTLTDHLTGVTVLDLPTAYWHHLVDDIDHTPWPDTLRLVILGGEQAHETALTRWHHHFGDRVRLINTYGPTEATVIATAAQLAGPDTTPTPGRPPIGRPIAATRITLLGPHGEPVPPGTPGELCISGPGLATGYHQRPDLTTQRFPTHHGTRHYRTGDRARLRPDGHLEYLGRLDDQIKLRGYRIEPGEIETHLQGRGAIAIHNETLIAYTAGPAHDLPATLHKNLPPHLVPTLWIELDALPLTPGGKLDRKALPAPTHTRTTTAPRTDAETLVAAVYTDVLGTDTVGAHDDFFTLGGHSLLAVKTIARLRTATDISLPIRTLFDHPTVEALAQALENALLEELDQLTDAEADQLLGGMDGTA